MKWVGLTGGIASGKTTVSNILKGLGVPIVDADQLAHQALRSQKHKISNYFGPEVMAENGEIDRKILGEKIFTNEKLKKALENIIHPFVAQKVLEKKRLYEVANYPLAIYDVPLLFENNLEENFDSVIVVYVSEATSVERLMLRNNLTKEQAKLRIANQIDIEEKKKKADIVFDNEGDIDSLKSQVLSWYNSKKE